MARNRVANLSGEILATSINVTSISLTSGLDVATQANNAYDQANSAFAAANNRVLKAGDTVTGELNVANNLIITGNVGIGSSNPSHSLQLGIPDANANNMLVIAGGMGKPIGLTSGAVYSEYTGISNGSFLVLLAGQGVKFKDFTNNQEWLNVTASSITTNANLLVASVNAQSFLTSTGANVSNAVLKTGDTMTGLLNVANNLVVTGNVGIGTSSTSNSIQINAVSPSIRLEETGSGGSKRLELSVANNGVARISADQSSQEIAFSTVGTERIRIGSNGAVLVGTTSDPTGSTTQHFFSHSGNNATAFIVGDAVDNSSISGIYIRSLDPRLVRPTNIPISIADTSGNKHVVIDGTGRVGIGTTSPSVQLFVASAESGYTANLAESVTKSAVLFKTHNSDSTVTSFGAISGGNGFIQRSNGPGTGTYAICLNPFGGNIGIGTTVANDRLHIKGPSNAYFSIILESNATNDYGSSINFADSTGTDASIFYSHYYNAMTFNNIGEKMRIESGGNIGIGTTSPANRLDVWGNDGGGASISLTTKTSSTPSFQQIWRVSNTGSTVNDAIMQLLDNGTAKISMAANASRGGVSYFNTGGGLTVGGTTDDGILTSIQTFATGVQFSLRDSSNIRRAIFLGNGYYGYQWSQIIYSDGGKGHIFANAAGTEVGSIVINNASTAFNTTSDYRLKDNPLPLTGSGEFIDALQPKTWTWKSNGERGAGFIAHEVSSVSPSSVTGEKDATRIDMVRNEDGSYSEQTIPSYQALEYGSPEFIANIIAELQSLRQRVAILENK